MKNILIVMTVLYGITLGSMALAQGDAPNPLELEERNKTPRPCNDPTGSGARFYDFDQIVIYYIMFPNVDVQDRPEYAKSLRIENFNDRLVKALKKNFILCMKDSIGREKPIYANMGNGNFYKRTPEEDFKKMQELSYDPKTLTFMIRLLVQKDNPSVRYVLLWDIHRSGLTGGAALPGLGDRSDVVVLENNEKLIEEYLDKSFKQLRPLIDNNVKWGQ